MKERLNGDAGEGFNKLSDEFSKSHKLKRIDLPKEVIYEYEQNQSKYPSR